MTTREPPRLALVLLERLVPDGAFLAGDLTEEYCVASRAAGFGGKCLRQS